MTLGESCPACGSDGWVADALAARILALPTKIGVVRCKTCGLGRLYPYFSEREIVELYGAAYFGDGIPDRSFAGVSAPTVNYEADLVPARLAKFRSTIRRLCGLHPNGKSILDFGAATGAFMAVAAAESLQADGVELSAHAIAVGKAKYGVKIRQGGVEAIPARRYDFIHLHHVFEHLSHPWRDLQALTDRLATGGLLYLEVPYQGHALERMRYRLARAPVGRATLLSFHHPYFYTPSSLARMLRRAGLELVSERCFVASNYPAHSLVNAVKKAGWWALDRFANLGVLIEIIGRRPDQLIR